MSLSSPLIAEIKHTASATRRILERVPNDRLNWKPHEKSMTLGRLASHVAELTQWMKLILEREEFDFAVDKFNRRNVSSADELLAIFDENIKEALTVLETASDDKLNTKWILQKSGNTMFNLPRKIAIRELIMNHIIHHRGQLSVYLRLLDIPVPGMYGQSADEKS